MPIAKQEMSVYEQMGRAALLPGMRYMLEQMQSQIDEFSRQLDAMQNPPAKTRRGRPPNATKEEAPTVRESRRGWSDDPEERKAEARRRRANRGKTKPVVAMEPGKKLHPRDPKHPKHAEFIAAIRKGVKKRWDGYTPAQRKAAIKKMVSGRASAPQLAVAS